MRMLVRILHFVQLIVLARLLSPEDFGLFAMTTLVMGFVEALVAKGLDQSLIQKTGGVDHYLDTLWTVQIIRGVILCVLVTALAKPVSVLFHQPQVIFPILAMATVPLLSGFVNPAILLFQKNLNFKKEALYRSLCAIFAMVVSIGAAIFWKNVWALVLGAVLEQIVQVVLSYILLKYKPRVRFDQTKFIEMFRFGGWVMGANVLKYAVGNLPGWVIVAMLGTSSLGVYSVAQRIAQTVGLEIAKVVNLVAFPALSRLQDNIARFRVMYLASQRLVSVVVFPLFGLIIAFSSQLVEIFLGPGWVKASEFVIGFSLLGILQSIGAFGVILKAIGKPRLVAVNSFYRLILMAVMIVPLTQSWGELGAIASAVIATVLVYPVTLRAAFSIVELKAGEFVRSISPSLLAGLLVCTAAATEAVHLDLAGVSGLILGVVCASAIYVLVLFIIDRMFGGYTVREMARVWNSWRQFGSVHA